MSEDTTETTLSGSMPSKDEIEAALLRAEVFAVRNHYLCKFQSLLPLLEEVESQELGDEERAIIDSVLMQAFNESTYTEEA